MSNVTEWRTYGTDRVQGDTPTTVSALKVGDVIRLYTGLTDTTTVIGIEAEMRQGTRRFYNIATDRGMSFPPLAADSRLDLATGGPRP